MKNKTGCNIYLFTFLRQKIQMSVIKDMRPEQIIFDLLYARLPLQ